ncbi:MAG: hypothetical protein ACTHMO_06315 [Rhodanobacteraceae bacterium]
MTCCIVLCALLAACGHADPDARTLPAPGGSAGAISAHGGEGANATDDSGLSDQGNPSNADDGPGDAQDDGSSTDDADGSTTGSTEPKVPGGTLTYTVVFSGHSELDTSEKHNVFDVLRRLQVTSRLYGSAVPSRENNAFTGKMEACGDDSACQQAVMMSLMAKGNSALEQNLHAMGRDRTWRRLGGPCHGTASVDDKGDNHWKGWDTKLNGRVSQQGTTTFDCRHVSLGIDFSGLELAAQMETHTYKLTLPRFQMEARYVFGDKAPTTRFVDFPSVVIKDAKFTTLEAPLHGSATVQNLDNPTEPLTAKVDWTFTPDAK